MIRPVIAFLSFERSDGETSAREVQGSDVQSIDICDECHAPFSLRPIELNDATEEVSWDIVSHFELFFPLENPQMENPQKKLTLVLIDEACEAEKVEIILVNNKMLEWKKCENIRINEENAAVKTANVFFPNIFRWKEGNIGFVKKSNFSTATGAMKFKISGEGIVKEISLISHAVEGIGDIQYLAMVNDLVAIYEDIILEFSSEIALSKGDGWLEQLNQLSKRLKQIEMTAGTRLEKVEIKQNSNKIKLFTSRTICDISMNQFGKARTLVDRESYDIYEHRIIRQFIDKIEKLALRKLKELSGDGVTEEEKRKWESIDKKSKRMKKSFAMIRDINVKDDYEGLHLSNLFANDSNYRKIYQIIKQMPQEYFEMSFDNKNKMYITQSYNVYEYWCLIKILWIFVDEYGFGMDSVNEREGRKEAKKKIKEKISNYFKTNHTTESISREELKVELHRTIGTERINATIIYQHQIKGGKKRPDFILKINFNNVTKIYIFDAKYRDFSRADISNWYTTLYEVAAYKYMAALDDGIDDEILEIDGAYIICSYTGEQDVPYIRNEQNAIAGKVSQYYGYDARNLLSYIEQEYAPLDVDKRSKMNDYLNQKEEIWDGHIGVVGMLPDNTIYFKNLIRMIMERFVNVDGDAETSEVSVPKFCWMCGGTNFVEIDEYEGKGGKYKCTNPQCTDPEMIKTSCGNGHKLFKHQRYSYNYQGNAINNPYNNTCPRCHGIFLNLQVY